jgi:hypothetical protein
MSDIFWVMGSDLLENQPSLPEVLAAGGILPNWVEIAHVITESPAEARAITANIFPISYHWPRGSAQPGFIFHDVLRLLLIREKNLALMAEKDQAAVHFALLASPQAVGRYNLMPHAHVTAWWTLPPLAITALPQKLDKSGFDPELVKWVAGENGLWEQAIATFPDAQPLEQPPKSIIGKLNCLIHQLDRSRSSHGLLLTGSADSPLLATLIER